MSPGVSHYTLSANTQRTIPRISSRLPRRSLRGRLRRGTSTQRRSASLAFVAQLLADKRSQHTNVVGRAMVEVRLVNRLEGVFGAAVETSTKLDGWVGAGAGTNIQSG